MKTTAETLLNDLAHFTGSEQFYRHPLFRKFIYTEGVQYLAEQAEGYWLLDYIFGKQEIAALSKEPFQTWTISLHDTGGASLIVEDGNKNPIVDFYLTFTDFPLQTFTLWLIEGTLLLPSEY